MAKSQLDKQKEVNMPIGVLAGGALNAASSALGIYLGQKSQEHLMKKQEEKDMRMWENTSYPAQKAMMEKAGLNPGLMYGMGGGAQPTTGSGSVPQATQFHMGINAESLNMMKAQRENTMADTKLKDVQADKLAGADTENVGANTNLTNITAEGKAFENRISKVRAEIAEETQEEQVKTIGYNMDKLLYETGIAEDQGKITRATRETVIDKARVDLFNAGLESAYIKAHTQNTIKDTGLKGEQTRATRESVGQAWRQIEAGIAQKWQELQTRMGGLSVEERQQAQDAWVNDVQNTTKLPIDVIKGIMGATILKGITNDVIRTPIGFKR